jgi:hypothetical protein
MTDQTKNEKVVARMITLRDQMQEIQRVADSEIAKLKEQYAKGEAFLLAQLNAMGEGASMKLSTGTVFTTQRLLANVADKGAFAQFVRETGEVELLQMRVSTTVLKDYMEQHDNAVPPGLNTTTARTINIRRPNGK